MSHKETHKSKEQQIKVYLVDIIDPSLDNEDASYRMDELESLVHTYWGIVVLKAIQKKQTPNYQTYVWSGKLEEIIEEMKELGATLLIVGNILKPSQIYKLNERLKKDKLEARDKVDTILKIFGKHAKNAEARLQIELAAIKHMWPRIYGMGMELSRQGWWIGTKGIWETNTERMKRHLREKIVKIKDKLKEYAQMRGLHRERRKRQQLPTVWIVWYTNAGKSSLLNSLTSKWVLAENKLFATLWTNVGKMFVMTNPQQWTGKEVLLNDTIGFMRDLPPQLFDAFSSTLEDSIESDILLHVVDIQDPEVETKIEVVQQILTNIGANQKMIYVFNKVDLVSPIELKQYFKHFKQYNPIFVSANTGVWLNELKTRIVEELQ